MSFLEVQQGGRLLSPRERAELRKRERAWKRSERARRLEKLQREMLALRNRKAAALVKAVEQCRKRREATREKVRALRARERERINREVERMREAARKKCATGKRRVKVAHGSLVAKRREAERERAKMDRAVARVDAAHEKKRAKREAEWAREDRQKLEYEFPEHLRVIWNQVKGRFKDTARRSAREAFLEWVEENQEDIAAQLAATEDKRAQKLIRDYEREQRARQKELDELVKKRAKALAKAGYSESEVEELARVGIDVLEPPKLAASGPVPF